MKQYTVLEFARLVLKKWYIVLLLPVLLSIVAVFVTNRYDQMNKTYTATSTVVMASKYDASDIKDTDQLRMVAQEYNKNLISTVKDLVKSSTVVKKSILAVEGADRYTNKQLMHSAVPKMQNAIRLVTSESSAICWVVVKHEDREKAKEYANQIVKTAALEQKSIWGKRTIKMLGPAITPATYDKHSRMRVVLIVGLASFVLMSAVVVVRDNK